MRAYNGFSGEQRQKAQAWLRAEWASGRLPRPSECMACGNVHGRIDAHCEDYSEPFRAGKTDQFHLCQGCHTIVHQRFRWPDAWDRHRERVANRAPLDAIERSAPPHQIAAGADAPDLPVRPRQQLDLLGDPE